jgi:hypothetical protein
MLSVCTYRIIDDPLEAFERMLREKDERDHKLRRGRRSRSPLSYSPRSRSRSTSSRSYTRSRSRSRTRSITRSRTRTPRSRTPRSRTPRKRSRTRTRTRSRSRSFTISRYVKLWNFRGLCLTGNEVIHCSTMLWMCLAFVMVTPCSVPLPLYWRYILAFEMKHFLWSKNFFIESLIGNI